MLRDRSTSSSRRTLAISWAAWAIGTILVAAYHWAAGVASHAYEFPLILEPHSSAQVHVFSLFGQVIEAEVIFQREQEDRRQSELGDWRTRASPDHALIFPNPGKRLAFAVSVNDGGVVNLEAMPAGGFGAGFAVRKLSEDQPTDRHRWERSPNPLKLRAAHGTNDVVFTVTDVDPALVGEKVTVLIQPPFGLMEAQRGYFVFILLWPLYLICLFGLPIWVIFLIRRSWREYRLST
jgi:hypothetical protein